MCNPSASRHPTRRGLAPGDAARRAERAPDRRGPPFVDRLPHVCRRPRRRGVDRRSAARTRRPAPLEDVTLDAERVRRTRRRRRRRVDPVGARRARRSTFTAAPAGRRACSSSRPRATPVATSSGTVAAAGRAGVALLRRAVPGARPSSTSGCSPRRAQSSRTAWRTPGSCASSTTTGAVTYYATYTAYDGAAIAQQLLATTDFQTFTSSPLLGAGGGQQGPGAVPPAHRRPLPRPVAVRRRAQRASPCPTTSGVGPRRRRSTWPTSRGARSRSATAGRRSSSTRAGSCSPTASARCGPTRSAPCSSTSTTRPSSSARRADRCITAGPTSRTATCPNVVYSCGALRPRRPPPRPLRHRRRRIGFATFTIADVLAALHRPVS